MRLFLALFYVAILAFLLMLFLNRRKQKVLAKVIEDINRTQPRLLINPEGGSYRGATAKYGRIKGDGVIYLTSERIVFHPLIGSNIRKVDLSQIVEISEDKWFLGSYKSGRKVLVLRLVDGEHVGFMLSDNALWEKKIREAKNF